MSQSKKVFRCIGCYKKFTVTEAANTDQPHMMMPTEWDMRLQINWSELSLLCRAARFACSHGQIPEEDRDALLIITQRLQAKQPEDAQLVALALKCPRDEFLN